MKGVRQNFTPEQTEKVKEVYDEITTAEKKEPKETVIIWNVLTAYKTRRSRSITC
ncbi:hypothetical protein [Bacillus wiedmannii]|uniref:hypothetical protein n=1 Tax=Bacillus wiedmannii TaxID=1890302 RepID=UPI00211D2928|nr:hypothetical protein [Bacillus wiedmannii]